MGNYKGTKKITMNKYLLFIAGLVSFTVLGSASACNNDTESAAEVAEEQIISLETPAQNSEEMEEVAIEAIGQKVKISTDLGEIIVLLYDQTPKHRDNFIKLAKEGFYDGLLFHRVMNNFMIQGGDPESKTATPGQMLGGGGPGYTIPAEFVDSLIHKKGALAAARQGDQVNPKKESSGSQYYIVHGRTFPVNQLLQMEAKRNIGKDSIDHFHYTPAQLEAYSTIGGAPFLDGDYTVFGEVIEGLDVIDAIAVVRTQRDRPLEDIKMTITLID